MSKRLFNWFDLRRISRQTFSDYPESEEELIAWSGTMFQMMAGLGAIVSQMGTLAISQEVKNGVYRTLEDSMQEILNVFNRYWPINRFEEFLNWIYENVITANIGYVKVLSEKEIEELQ